MGSKIIRSIYFITLILFSGIVLAITFAGLNIIPQAKGIIEDFGYNHYSHEYIAIYLPIAAISLWLKPLKLLRHFIYAGFFILLVVVIFSNIIKGDSRSLIFLLFIPLLLLSVNYYCFYITEIKKQKHKYLMCVSHKKIKENDSSGEIGSPYSDRG